MYYAYEIAHIVQDGIKRMYGDGSDGLRALESRLIDTFHTMKTISARTAKPPATIHSQGRVAAPAAGLAWTSLSVTAVGVT